MAVATVGLHLAGGAVSTAAESAPDRVAPPSPAPDLACVEDFDRWVQPILNLKCVQCHQSSSPDAGLSLQSAGTAERIVMAPSRGSPFLIVDAGRADTSFLFLKITGRQRENGGSGARMPLIGAMLPEASIETIRTWIEGCSLADSTR